MEEDRTTRSGKQYKTVTSHQRRASVPSTATAAAGQIKAKTMSSDAVAQALLKLNESLEFLTKQGAESSKQLAEVSAKLDLNMKSINELGKKVNSNTQSIEKLLEESATTRKIAEEAKGIAVATQEKIPPVYKKLEDHELALSMLELQRKERNLRIRAVPESEKDNLADFLTKEFSDFWQQELEKEEFKIVAAFRLGRRQNRKKPRDCLITLGSKEERDKILNLHYQRTLEIENSFVEIFKDIPKHILDVRAYYKDLVDLLRKNRIPFRWEFPQGLSFKYKGRKTRIKSVSDKDQFLRDNEEDLLKEVAGVEPSLSAEEIPDIANLSYGLNLPTEEEQQSGAVGGKSK